MEASGYYGQPAAIGRGACKQGCLQSSLLMSVCSEIGVHAALSQCEAVTVQLVCHAPHCSDRDLGSGADGGHVPRGRSPCTQAPSAPSNSELDPRCFQGRIASVVLSSSAVEGFQNLDSGSPLPP